MIPIEEARTYVMDRCAPLAAVATEVADALGLVTAVDVTAKESLPPFANTAMDGFAVRSADLSTIPARLQIIETIAAGHSTSRAIGQGDASRIMTGAPIPDGADAIVMVEKTSVDGDTVSIETQVEPGNHIRPAGDDVVEGDLVFPARTELSAGHLGLLCCLGLQGAS